MQFRRFSAVVAWIVCTWSATSVLGEDATKESVAYGVNKYGAIGECCSGCSDLSHAADDATGVRNGFNGIGYQENFAFINTLARGNDFSDPAKVFGGHDAAYQSTDYADAVFYSGHGISSCPTGQTPHAMITMGTSTAGTCDPSTRDHMLWGNVSGGGDANVVMFAACQVLQRCIWNGGGFWSMDGGGETSIVNSFHGNSWDNADNTERYWLYVGNSRDNGLGDNWVDMLTIEYPFRDDQCAISLIFGETPEKRRDQYNNGGFNDLHNVGPHYGATYKYICSCDPNDGPGLPGC